MSVTNPAVTSAMIPVSAGEMVKRITNAPMISTPQMMIHSGTWWAASQISKRSLTTRLIMSPEFTRSK
ncbi:unknown [Collinsella sp. CAG:398]|nr:unknown [Collinsella sp. CAG:398]